MEFISPNWGDLAGIAIGIIGVLVSATGLYLAVRAARAAQTAAQAAERATRETRRSIQRHLATVDIERANARIEYIKNLHRSGRWEAALEWYPEFRTMLHDIGQPLANLDAESGDQISEAVSRILEMEFVVDWNIQSGSQPDVAANNLILSRIQSELRDANI